ncbi:MAG: hypothetical protein SF187_14075 [Deltaproteobacteria bacterium]|nr:hypothetical protein [Deltaproteobacteria bacterium]
MRCFVPLLAAGVCACGADEALTRVNHPGPLDETFAVSSFFTPSGYMGDGENLGLLNGKVNEGCKARPTGAQGDCYVFEYRVGALGWAGVYWVYPANNWGSRPGRKVQGAGFKNVRLKAAVDPPGTTVNFVVGGIADPLLPHRDRVSATTSVKLSKDWTDVELDIAGQDFSEVIGALAWSMAYPTALGDRGVARVYLDDVVWDINASKVAAP